MNKTPQIPTFPDAMDNFARMIGYNLYCHLPGEVVSFDRATGLASVKVGLKRVVPDYTVPTGQKLQPYPELDNVTVYTLQGSGGSVGADPRAGDPCLICVIDRNVDAWRTNGGQQAPLSSRAHDLSDAFCFVGFNPLATPLVSARLASECGIADALAKVVVKDGKISIGNGTDTLKAIINDTITQIVAVNAGLMLDIAVVPNAGPAALAANIQLTLILTRLAALLY